MKGQVALLLALGLGCAQAPRSAYDWHGYDTSLYANMKDPSSLEVYGQSLKWVIESNPNESRIPPGIRAEYGYVLFATGHKPEAMAMFRKEKERWPESAKIMDRMIATCLAPNPIPVQEAR